MIAPLIVMARGPAGGPATAQRFITPHRIFKSVRAILRRCAAAVAPALLLAGCAAGSGGAGAATGLIVAGAGRALPPGTDAAYVVEIDGERVAWSQSQHLLAPGRHVIRVVPRVEGPVEQVPSAEALATRWPNEPVTLDVAAGRTYVIGLRMLERLDPVSGKGRWEAVVVGEAGRGR